MATAREIQTRIRSIQDTMKITNAMYMISSAKVKKARRNLENTEQYFEMLQGTIARIVRHMPEMEHRYFESGTGYETVSDFGDGAGGASAADSGNGTGNDGVLDPAGKKKTGSEAFDHAGTGKSGSGVPESDWKVRPVKRGYIVIAADKGLAGAYNHNVVKLTEECLGRGRDNLVFVVGELGREYFIQHKIPVYMQFHYAVQDPNLTRARDIADCVISLYEAKELDELYVVYTHAVNSMKVEARVKRLLPLKKEVFASSMLSDVYAEDIRMVPSAESVLDNVVPDYITGFIYGALVESFCSEQNARMMAMEAATDNAEKILKELRIAYNRVRQGAITQEITEVIAGAKAQKKRRRKV